MIKLLKTLYIRCYYCLAKFYVFSNSDISEFEDNLKHLEILKICLRKSPDWYLGHELVVEQALSLKKLELAYASACACLALADYEKLTHAKFLQMRCFLACADFFNAEKIIAEIDIKLGQDLKFIENACTVYLALENKSKVMELLARVSRADYTPEMLLLESALNQA